MSAASRPAIPLRPLFVLSLIVATLLLLGWGWVERRWTTAGFYLVILLLTAIFAAPPLWSYTRTAPLDESPEADRDFRADSALEEAADLRHD